MLSPLLAMTILLDHTGEMRNSEPTSVEWAEDVMKVYKTIISISWSTIPPENPKIEQARAAGMETTTALHMVKLDLDALKEMIRGGSTSSSSTRPDALALDIILAREAIADEMNEKDEDVRMDEARGASESGDVGMCN
ncbi:hypothetical protein CGRA01v4_14004 [Colletotrichum graminicola]|nr:hypothetical protein CGRA01v4_14004 [Colletotrichum graminicola]